MWGCGLKLLVRSYSILIPIVTPYVGVWIEISQICECKKAVLGSPPMWGCGLKFDGDSQVVDLADVTPYVGVWIEIPNPE